ncbi:MAG: hypothetical protein V3W31_05115 [Thermodesulfobacteriota bacterium]
MAVKAYPNPSKKYGETVCVAGVDIDSGEWRRLYPIPFRDLDSAERFKKYSVIEVKVSKAKDDARPESFKVDISNKINVVDVYDTSNGWEKRKKVLLPTVSASLCEVYGESKSKDKSLGMFRPHNIGFHWKVARKKDQQERKSCYAQLSFYNKRMEAIEPIPYDFRYSFYCQGEPGCAGHTLPIIDWEIGQAYRQWRGRYKDENTLLEKIKETWLDRICAEKNDIYFFVGNWQRFRDKFMILGVFYPPAGTG